MHSFSTKSAVTLADTTESEKKTTLSERLQAMPHDKRGAQKAIPIDIGRYLNESQLLALHSLEGFGWRLNFVRRPLFMVPTVVVSNPESSQYAVLEDDGSVNLKSAITLRH